MTLLAIAFCAEGLFLAFYIQPGARAIDYYHIYHVPQAVRRGVNVYDAENHPLIVDKLRQQPLDGKSARQEFCESINQRLYATGFCPTATPFLYTVHSVHSQIPFDVGYWLFQISATVACFAGLYLTARASGLSRNAAWLCCGLGTSFCWGLLLDGQLANVSRFQILGIALAIAGARSKHPMAALGVGLILALGCAYKPTMVPSLGLWLTILAADRRWTELVRGLGGAMAGGLVGLLAPLAMFGTLECWWQWRSYASAELLLMAQSFPGNYSLLTFLAAGGNTWAGWLPWIFGAGIVGALAWSAERSDSKSETASRRWSLAIAMGPLWLVLSSPLVWIQYTSLILPLAIVLVGNWLTHPATGRIRTVALWVGVILSSGMVLRFVPDKYFALEVATLWTGCLILLAVAVSTLGTFRIRRKSTTTRAQERTTLDRQMLALSASDWSQESMLVRSTAVAHFDK